MAKEYSLYFARIQIGEIDQASCCFEGEAEATLNALLLNFEGRVERSFPFKDREHECINMIPFHKTEYDHWLHDAVRYYPPKNVTSLASAV